MKKFLRNRKPDNDFEPPPTFKAELNRLSKGLVLPGMIIAAVAWLFFIHLDKQLHAGVLFIPWLRRGLTFVAIVSGILFFVPYFKKRLLVLVYILLYYLAYSTAIILGMVRADPIYMGGFCIIILVFGWAPIERVHAFFLLFSSLLVFLVVGLFNDMFSDKFFESPGNVYGVLNVLASIAISVPAIYFLDRARRTSYENSVLIFQKSEELKKANKLKGELLQIAAHDLKDPLQVIIGYTHLLQTKLHDDPFAIEKLSKIYKSTDQMIKLITGLLESASIESGKLELKKVDVDVGEMANDVAKSYQPASEKKNQQIILEAKRNCILSADKTRLRQVMENLVGNAVKFSPPGKSIWVSVDRRDSLIIFKVRDQGPGLTEEDKEKLFERFQRLSAKPTGGEPSYGLGLALSRDLVKLHGGDIKVKSQRGEGSEFIVELPTREPEEKQ